MCSSSDCILPGPPSRSNLSAADLSPSGLLAFASGSSVSLVDSRSLQLISSVSLPSPISCAFSTVTSVRWAPVPVQRDLFSSDLLIAVGDHLGRIALVDFRLCSVRLWLEQSCDSASARGKSLGCGGVQDLCWVLARPDSYVLAAITGPSSLSLYTDSGQLFWKYDASPEYLSCIRCDPFDSRHFCVLGLKGFLLSLKLLGTTENDVPTKEFQIQTDCSDLQKLEREVVASSSHSTCPASAVFPLYSAKFSFSPHWKHILFATFPRELFVFDLKYEAALYVVALPRGYAKFVDVLPDPSQEFLYCLHLDGRLSIWRRKEGEQVHVLCAIEEFMPTIGNSVPSPSLLTLLISQLDSTLQNIRTIHSDALLDSSELEISFDFNNDAFLLFKTHFISISDDGKIWSWILTFNGDEDSNPQTNENLIESPTNGNQDLHPNISFEITLVGQLQLLSSAVTVLAIPTPSMTATLARGGNFPAVVVPLVALGTEAGTIDVVDVSANAVAASFSAHTSSIRGLNWLGNSRLVSYSCSRVSKRTGGYVNKLVVTCLRSGVSRGFRVLQKPERAPIRALRASSSGRYLLILFRDAPVEVWAMTKSPVMLRSLALPFTVLEWTLPTIPSIAQKSLSKQLSMSSNQEVNVTPSDIETPNASDSKAVAADALQDDASESFAFALVNGSLGVFEVYGRRIRDFRPKWPASSFISTDGLITAMAYRLPHVVTGDKLGNIRWWDVVSGNSSSFNTCKEGIKKIKFSPVFSGDISRGRITVLFYDNTFSIYDLDSPDPLAISLMRPQIPGTLILELDWLPLRTSKFDSLVLCVAGTDGSFRLVEVHLDEKMTTQIPPKERFRSVPLCTPMLLPTPHALLGVKPSWFNTSSTCIDKRPHSIPGRTSSSKDLRSFMIDFPPIGDPAVLEMFLKVLEPYRSEGCLLDDEKAKLYSSLVNKGCAARFAFAAAIFGETSEALFWLQLPSAMKHVVNKTASKSAKKQFEETATLSKTSSKGPSSTGFEKNGSMSEGQLRLMAFEQKDLWVCANERIPWHEKLEGEEAIQNRVHELVSVGNLEGAVSLLLSTSPDSSYFYPNALRAVALSSTVSKSLVELAVKVVAANMVRSDRSLSGTHLLCSVGRYQEACSQLQDAGCWTDSATLAATHLNGSDYARVLQRWAGHVVNIEHNLWRGVILYVAVGAFEEALAVFRKAERAETAAIFIMACRETLADSWSIDPKNEDVMVVTESYALYQRKLVHLCMDSPPSFH
ncbi:Transducin family protein / WD-40 repeat family protein [Arabidopsis thaliana]|uniref:Transducin family protein / WD-40 repeat family protein n=1 Tax=Arabidopsis thaliana TaxID=3702 RepID=F4IUN0_ARATH|nr:Transducin family protein / WD-40 repeat family protein [Arabidopsis thaliana]AEC07867.1 Transducin family protein / WD-40 repeat family protein [Arabidopsis thaliana]|eukprot:NP_850083.1 Transducin family protein / WD-40 repeat family protein [Arabidopsis thaliana]